MREWKKVRIGEFLTERQGRYKPDDNAIVTYKRLDKIDFSGTVHISEKPSKTDMIVVQPGDLVISGINVAKGAIAVYQGTEPVTATIHYSSYIFDDSAIDLNYFKYFVKSPAFIETLKKQVKGGIKTEIKPKVFLPLEISLPDLPTQKQIVKRISVNLKRVNELAKEIETQKGYAKQLRRNILQDAIEGKLTADWRKDHPVQKGNPDYDAEALFELIQKEKKADKKRKMLPPILDAEKPFELPTGWKWVRLGEICNSITDGDHLPPPKQPSGIPFVVISDISSGKIHFRNKRFVSRDYFNKLPREKIPETGDILYTVTGSYGIPVPVNDFQFCVQRHIGIIKPVHLIKDFLFFSLMSPICKKQADGVAWGVAVKTIPIKELRNFMIPLPPLAEQKEIVRLIENMLLKVEQLEQQIVQREEYTNQLMQTILKRAFEDNAK
ncbi:restriction endonuclease subunit S [Treponema vincentii]|uniref:restriction endonuclease subunit S n=1 Tax=Treponema vincentii TaxID=69710 RepID=UPI0020A2D5D4|nr:restriction endonuclease subunit S [Treponema vincentii]UTC59737.1 restriction endonuclease subunit S [Treponema vincentii]